MPTEPASSIQYPEDSSTLSTTQVVKIHQDMVYAIAVSHTQCLGDAADVFQETFLTYHRKQPALQDAEHLKAWLIRVTINCAHQVRQSSWRTRIVPIDPQAVANLPEVASFAHPQQDAVFEALQSLPPTYRSVIHLFYMEELSIREIASALDIESGAVKMRLSRGRTMLRDYLKETQDD